MTSLQIVCVPFYLLLHESGYHISKWDFTLEAFNGNEATYKTEITYFAFES